MNNKLLVYLPPVLAALLMNSVVTPALAVSPEPSRLEVQLLNRQDGKPVANAAVCLGTSARMDQFGARRSDARGVASFEDVGAYPLVLTVSGQGYQGSRRTLEPLYESRLLVVKLATGGGGPVCDAPAQNAADVASAPLSLDTVRIRDDINAAPAGVLVATRVSGSVNEIRISEQANFGDADWQPYQPAVPFTLSAGDGVKQLYVQVRRVAQAQGASIEVVSPVKKVTYRRH